MASEVIQLSQRGGARPRVLNGGGVADYVVVLPYPLRPPYGLCGRRGLGDAILSGIDLWQTAGMTRPILTYIDGHAGVIGKLSLCWRPERGIMFLKFQLCFLLFFLLWNIFSLTIVCVEDLAHALIEKHHLKTANLFPIIQFRFGYTRLRGMRHVSSHAGGRL